ncbi:MAG: polysaccharide pyruvyl transferase family protein [Actinobacteria bacterium]|nr:polysaccharide pyruvyl transferase family protein [Actinomycetota bacterium]
MSAVLLVNHWHDDNKGDSAITLATLDMLAPPGAGTAVVASLLPGDDPAFARAFRHVTAARPDVVVRPSLVPSIGSKDGVGTAATWVLGWIPLLLGMLIGHVPGRIRSVLSGADRVVLIGGSNIFDSGKRRPLGTLRLLQLLYPLWAADRLGRPVDLVGHTIGPFGTGASRALVRRLLPRARSIVLREEYSMELLRELVPQAVPQARVEPDTAFAIRQPTADQVDAVTARYGLAPQRFLVLVPRQHPYHADAETDRVVDELAAGASAALAEGSIDRVVVLSQCLGPSVIEDDRPVARRLADAIPGSLLVEEDLTVVDLVAFFAAARAVVSVRLHGAILAMSAGTPVHAIAYFTTKTAGVLAQCGMADRWSEFETFSAVDVARLLQDVDPADVVAVAARERRRLTDWAGTAR